MYVIKLCAPIDRLYAVIDIFYISTILYFILLNRFIFVDKN